MSVSVLFGSVRRAAVLTRSLPGWVVVCAVNGGCVEMAGVAAKVWAAIPEHGVIAVGELVEILAMAERVDALVVAEGVEAVVCELVRVGCLIRVG